MKKFICIILILVMVLSSTYTYATIAEKLESHWANSIVNRSFVAYYFPYLAKENFLRFDPNTTISELDFTISLASLLKDYNYDLTGIGAIKNITRNDMVMILGSRLAEIGVEIDETENVLLPFKDINTMSSDRIELLRILYNSNIIVGDSNSSFSPDRELTQVEAIIILQRVKEVLENMNAIAFNTLGIVQSYSSQEEIIIKEEDNKVLLTITKQFPTPGYSMSINKILKSGNGYRIFFNITSPSPDSILPQVITYKTLTLDIDKELLNEPPYSFILDGFNSVRSN